MPNLKAAQLIFISIDGLHLPHHFHPDPLRPNLSQLQKLGSYSHEVEPIYPSVTYSNHTSLATGYYSDRHGILANTEFIPEHVKSWNQGESQDWFFNSSKIQTPTLWNETEKRGLKTAIIRWPVTVGAQVSWLIPEVFPTSSNRNFPVGKYMLQHSTPDLVHQLQMKGIEPLQNTHESLDQFTCDAAIYCLKVLQPNFMLLHFSLLDHTIHQHGKDSQEAQNAFAKVDQWIGQILKNIDPDQTSIFIFGDHGFLNFQKRVHVNTLFKEKNWIETQDHQIKDWKVIAHTNCAQAAVYLKDGRVDESFKQRVIELLQENSCGVFKVWTRDDLDRLHAFPQAICAIEANPGFSLGQDLDGLFVEDLPSIRGEHGYFPASAELFTEFFAAGPGIQNNMNLGKIRIIDIAPTAAKVLGFSLPQSQGRCLPIFSKSNSRL